MFTETPLKMTEGGEMEFLLSPTCWTMTPVSRAPEQKGTDALPMVPSTQVDIGRGDKDS